MKIRTLDFLISAVWPEQYPEGNLPEIAFAGRSNVGKSSLINMLLNRKNFARTSQTPGKTQTINFYEINGDFRFVDLPGYGYAKVSKSQRESWGKIIGTYLESRENLVEIIQLVDSRHKPSDEDKSMYSWIREAGFNGIVIATKADKLKQSELARNLKMIERELGCEDSIIIPVSAVKRRNKYKVWDLFLEIFKVNGYDVVLERQSND